MQLVFREKGALYAAYIPAFTDGGLFVPTPREYKLGDDIYLLRVEQLYPWPMKSLIQELQRFPNAELVWCQEEPKNMGGWTFAEPWIELTLEKLDISAKRARYAGRPASASTAAGQMSKHLKELEALMEQALG